MGSMFRSQMIYILILLFRLPWRSVRDEQTIISLKHGFCNSDCFRRLPRELRRLYRDMHLTPGPAMIEHQ